MRHGREGKRFNGYKRHIATDLLAHGERPPGGYGLATCVRCTNAYELHPRAITLFSIAPFSLQARLPPLGDVGVR
jgi:hypothetical protein